MNPRHPSSDASSQFSDQIQPTSGGEPLTDYLRGRGVDPQSFRFADVSHYIDQDGYRYQIQRVGPTGSPPQHLRPPPPPPPKLSPPARIDGARPRITDRSRFAEGLSHPFPPVVSGQRLGRSEQSFSRPAEQLTNHEEHWRLSNATSITVPTNSGDSQAPMNQQMAELSISPTDTIYSTIDTHMWHRLGGDGPRLDFTPIYPRMHPPPTPKARPPSRAERIASPIMILGTSRSNTSIPHSVSNGIDLRTPILVMNSETSTTSGESLAIETETPGERLVLEMNLAVAMTLQSDFVHCTMRVFVNQGTDDMRFYIASEGFGNRNAQSFRFQRSNTSYVPIYGYSPSHVRMVCIRESLRRRKRTRRPNAEQSSDSEEGISIYCDFYQMQDLFTFQQALLDEEVFLDIERARYLKIYESGLHTRQIDAPRLQIWREGKSDKALFDDNMSHYTAGTMLSGPMKDRVAPTASRLMIYMGRSEEFITLFITDDVTLQEKGATKVALAATKYGLLRSRSGVQCYHATRNQLSASITLDKSGMQYNDQNQFTNYKSLEIEFENEQSKFSFVETWEKVLRARRRERRKLQSIQEEVSKEIYDGKTARKIVM
ncbi:hypothetical protein M011DRAFT_487603 [Sporormia fimetaria CBS 119925]|uniref:Uncharacterized protein n=1 Tax=Sporormia fimetaria CBS 119925 TaxID=1340428 RepID=A0A6A6V671_9PLEO|nr:hypothetical protein M011DRAFT_487603 [Sporormia fimetaria CBS 119925]